VSKIYEDFVLAGNKIKGDLIGSNASQTRFKVIAAIISKYKFDVIIEAGTQHGASALFTKKFLNQKNKDCKIFSIDVSKYQAPLEVDSINRIILDPPVRKNFKEQTQALITSEKSVLYFHDSDHSYENMVFEFDWAWNHLKSKVIIADEVENNSAFYEFVNNEKTFFIIYKFDSGPAVGIAIRT
jgi:cephalosporin hydroxylase